MFYPHEYKHSVNWSEKDNVYICRVEEFPSLITHGDSPEGALYEMKQVLSFCLEDLRKKEQAPPIPFRKRKK